LPPKFVAPLDFTNHLELAERRVQISIVRDDRGIKDTGPDCPRSLYHSIAEPWVKAQASAA
jgi:hypothetical protein